MSPGDDVWVGLGAAVALWGTFSALGRGIPGPVAVIRWFAQSWLGRALTLCAWAGAGWHLFCQRP